MQIINDWDKILCKRNLINELTIGKYYIMVNYHNEQYWILSDGILIPIHIDHIWDYFYTNQEVRKLKLKSLCE